MPHRTYEVGTLAVDGWAVTTYTSYSEAGTGRDRSPSRLLLAVPNVTAHPSTAIVPITVLPVHCSAVLMCP